MALGINIRSKNLGLLILRLGIGIMLILHGFPKIQGGPSMWQHLGRMMNVFGIDFALKFWGFIIAFSEFFGGICIILGLFFRLFCVLLSLVMVTAIFVLLDNGKSILEASEAIQMAIVFFSLLIIGPGRFSYTRRFRQD